MISVKAEWTDMLQTYKRGRDQLSLTGIASLDPWPFHDQMTELTAGIATIVPPNVCSTFMTHGETEDNRPDRVPRNTSMISIEALIEARHRHVNTNFEHNRPQRELAERYRLSAIEAREQSRRFMDSFLVMQERMLQNMERRREIPKRTSVSFEERLAAIT